MNPIGRPYNKINYLNRGAQGIDIVALGIDFVAVRARAQSVYKHLDIESFLYSFYKFTVYVLTCYGGRVHWEDT